MPRPERQDLHPIIYMRDVSTSRRLAQQVVENGLSVNVYARRQRVYYYRIYNDFSGWVNFLQEEEYKGISYDVLMFLLNNMEMASALPINLPPNPNGDMPFRVVTPGCRINLTQNEICEALKCSQEKIRLSISKFRVSLIIVNSGNGWYELNARFFWKGPEDIRQAYIPIQDEFQRIEIIDSRNKKAIII